MTALHWACYHNDSEVMNCLIKRNADRQKSIDDLFPVDIAGACDRRETVKTICQALAYHIFKEKMKEKKSSQNDILS